MYYANQKQITIKKEIVQGSKKNQMPYLIAYKANLEDAMKDLTATTFKVYVCLLCISLFARQYGLRKNALIIFKIALILWKSQRPFKKSHQLISHFQGIV